MGFVTTRTMDRFGMISPSRARAGSRVGDASRWRSMASNTRMNFRRFVRRRCNSMTKMLMLSHLPSVSGVSSSSGWFVRASFTAVRARSSKCLVVIHSGDGTIADGVLDAFKTCLIVVDFPVAWTPWTTRRGGEGGLDCRKISFVMPYCGMGHTQSS